MNETGTTLLVEKSEIIVVSIAAPEFVDDVYGCHPDQTVLDLVRLPLDFSRVTAQYDGIC